MKQATNEVSDDLPFFCVIDWVIYYKYIELSKNQHYEKATSCFTVCSTCFFWAKN